MNVLVRAFPSRLADLAAEPRRTQSRSDMATDLVAERVAEDRAEHSDDDAQRERHPPFLREDTGNQQCGLARDEQSDECRGLEQAEYEQEHVAPRIDRVAQGVDRGLDHRFSSAEVGDPGHVAPGRWPWSGSLDRVPEREDEGRSMIRRHEEAASPRRSCCARCLRSPEGPRRIAAAVPPARPVRRLAALLGSRRNHHQIAPPPIAAATIPPTAVVGPDGGVGIRSRSRTRRVKVRVSQPCSRAARATRGRG